MKILIFLLLILGSLTAFGQRSGTHCLSIEDSRFLHERALKSVYLDSAVNALEGKMIVLEENSARREKDFSDLISEERDKNKVAAEMLTHQKQLTEGYKDENGALRKQVKREKRKRNAAGGIAILVIVLALL